MRQGTPRADDVVTEDATAELDTALRNGPLHVALRAAITARGLPLQRVQRTDRFVAVHHGDPGCTPDRMSVHALENCRTGRVRRHHDTGVLVAELLFDTRLRAGDTFLFRYAVEDGTAGVSREYVRGFGVAGGQYALQVRFDDGSLPVRCHRFAQHSAAAPRSGRQELPVSARHRSVHLVEPRLRPGILGIGWDWE